MRLRHVRERLRQVDQRLPSIGGVEKEDVDVWARGGGGRGRAGRLVGGHVGCAQCEGWFVGRAGAVVGCEGGFDSAVEVG